MPFGPDTTILWSWGPVQINLTLVSTWIAMLVLVGGSWLVTRRMREGREPSRWQLALELVVDQMRSQIREAGAEDPDPYLGFIGTLFLFIAGTAILAIVPGYPPPTASLSTTAALAATVFLAIPAFAVAARGWREYLRDYVRPTPLMLPFHVVGELSRTLALAVRLFGNIMSGQLIVAIIVSIIPFLFPAVLQAFGLLIGVIQAYVFGMLALVYVLSAVRTHAARPPGERPGAEEPGAPAAGASGHAAGTRETG